MPALACDANARRLSAPAASSRFSSRKHVNASYYIAKGQKTLGPCTLDDLRNFLAYGSIQKGDLVMRDGDQQWHPVASVIEIVGDAGSTEQAGKTSHTSPRRRTVRYRDYERVPRDQRAGQMVKWMIVGFLFFPPLLWRAAVSIYSQSIYSRRTNEDGYLLFWSRRPEVLVTILIMVNAILWWALVMFVVDAGAPFFRDFMDAMRAFSSGMKDLF